MWSVMQHMISVSPVLFLSDFSVYFTVELDASSKGVAAIHS